MDKELRTARHLRGEITVPGDKSISHRAAMIGAIAEGVTEIGGFLRAADPLSTLQCIHDLGVETKFLSDTLSVHGKGLHGLRRPEKILDAGNSGTTIRLLTGILAGQKFSSEISGDAYLTQRPMRRIIEPLTLMGASISASRQQTAPLTITSVERLHAIDYVLPVASAQVKSAILLAGIFADGTTSVFESKKSRDHTERMLNLEIDHSNGMNVVKVVGKRPIYAKQFYVPGDPSSAAFFIVAGLIVPNSEIVIKNISVNPTRIGFIQVLQSMGANIKLEGENIVGGETIGNVVVSNSSLQSNIVLRGKIIPNIIDEIPILAVAAIFAKGTFEVRDASELRTKECDRIRAICYNIKAMGLEVEEFQDGFAFESKDRLLPSIYDSFGDHRIAMAFGIAGVASEGRSMVTNAECVDISFPSFWKTLEQLVD